MRKSIPRPASEPSQIVRRVKWKTTLTYNTGGSTEPNFAGFDGSLYPLGSSEAWGVAIRLEGALGGSRVSGLAPPADRAGLDAQKSIWNPPCAIPLTHQTNGQPRTHEPSSIVDLMACFRSRLRVSVSHCFPLASFSFTLFPSPFAAPQTRVFRGLVLFPRFFLLFSLSATPSVPEVLRSAGFFLGLFHLQPSPPQLCLPSYPQCP